MHHCHLLSMRESLCLSRYVVSGEPCTCNRPTKSVLTVTTYFKQLHRYDYWLVGLAAVLMMALPSQRKESCGSWADLPCASLGCNAERLGLAFKMCPCPRVQFHIVGICEGCIQSRRMLILRSRCELELKSSTTLLSIPGDGRP